mmetsp:Transcript_15929/g.32000  ORF Transcript_15929/g.32000 Transcript_15929/m.32000 type:complete len:331 (-) Transcript_15929:1720-2712(-)
MSFFEADRLILEDPLATTNHDQSAADKLKEAGNAAFRGARWEEALHHYTRLMTLYPDSPAVPVALANRAAVLLKLERFVEAHDDASQAIDTPAGALSEKIRCKAFHRRAQARRRLGKLHDAAADLQCLIRIDPQSNLAREELREVQAAIQASATAMIDTSKSTSIAVEQVAPSRNLEHRLDPPEKRPRGVIKPISAERIREIMRRSDIPPPPTSAIDFEQGFRSVQANRNDLRAYLLSITPSAYPRLISLSLTSELLCTIVDAVSADIPSLCDPGQTNRAFAILQSLPLTQRFAMIVDFLSDQEKETLRTALDRFVGLDGIQEIRERYRC